MKENCGLPDVEETVALDAGIRSAVVALRAVGVETFESCEGGPGHACPQPMIRFHGHIEEGWRALSAALSAGLRVQELRRIWPVIDKEPTGPWWELTFVPTSGPVGGDLRDGV